MDINVQNIDISKLIETTNNFKYFVGYLDDDIRPLVLILLKMSGLVKIIKNKLEISIRNIRIRNWCSHV